MARSSDRALALGDVQLRDLALLLRRHRGEISPRDFGQQIKAPGFALDGQGVYPALRQHTSGVQLAAAFKHRRQCQTEFGALQAAMWKRQFTALRDGDRFYFENDPGLRTIRERYGIDFRTSLGRLVAANTDVDPADLAANVFRVPV